MPVRTGCGATAPATAGPSLEEMGELTRRGADVLVGHAVAHVAGPFGAGERASGRGAQIPDGIPRIGDVPQLNRAVGAAAGHGGAVRADVRRRPARRPRRTAPALGRGIRRST